MYRERMPSESSSGIGSMSTVSQAPAIMEFDDLTDFDLTDFIADETWSSRCANCIECNEFVPHRLLYICRYRRCDGFFEPEKDHEVPADFYKNEKVFCSRCAFTGSHKHHAEAMEGAHPIAVAMALKDQDDLKVTSEQLAFLNHEDPVDFMIANEIKLAGLPVLPIEQRLYESLDSYDFQVKKSTFEDLRKIVEKCRIDGAEYAKECAEKVLAAYDELAEDVRQSIKENELSSNAEIQRESNRLDSGTTESTVSFQYENEESQIVENSSILPADTVAIKQLLNSLLSFSADVISNEVDETTAKMICSNLNLRYDQIRDDMLIEAALQDVSDKLHEFAGSKENKMAAARMFKEKNNVALYYPPQ